MTRIRVTCAVTTLLLTVGFGATLAEDPAEPASTAADFGWSIDPVVLSTIETRNITNSARFEEYVDRDSGFQIPLLRVTGRSSDQARQFEFTAHNVRRDDARYRLDYDLAGRWDFELDYNKIPHRFVNDGRLLWNELEPGRLAIADPLQSALQDELTLRFSTKQPINYSFLLPLLQPYLATSESIDVGLQRDRLHARLGLGSLGKFRMALDYRSENRDGTRALGGSFGFNNVTEIPEPIHYQTRDIELSGEWATHRAGMVAGYRVSKFENRVDTLVWDNPFRITDSTSATAYLGPSSSSVLGSSRGVFDLAPDNQAHTAFVQGRVRWGKHWQVNGYVQDSTMKQDDTLLPYTLNSAIDGIGLDTSTFDATDPANLPIDSADAEVSMLNYGLNLSGAFGSHVDLAVRHSFNDYETLSRRTVFPGYVRFHATWEAIPRLTVPYAWEQTRSSAEIGFKVNQRVRFGVGAERNSFDRTFREIETSDEDTIHLTVDATLHKSFTIRGHVSDGEREISDYSTAAQEFSFFEPEGINNQPGLRKFDQAAREVHRWDYSLVWTPGEAFSLTAGIGRAREDYVESSFGLLGELLTQYNAELNYMPSERLNTHVYFHRSDREVGQRGRQSGGTLSTNPLDDWFINFDERQNLWGVGLDARLSDRWTTTWYGQWTESEGYADFFSPPGGTPNKALDLPNYEDIRLRSIGTRLQCAISEAVTGQIGYAREHYTIDSFILSGLQHYLPGSLLINGNGGNYDASIVSVELAIRF